MSTPAIIRPAAVADAHEIHDLISHYADMGNLLPRPINDIYRHLRDFFVAELDGKVVACCALEIFTENLGEVRSLVVASEVEGKGYGRLLVQEVINEAKRLGLRRLMALTYVPEFFHRLGFRTVSKDMLPEKVWGICIKCYKYNNCDEIAVLLEM
ncbi:MAG: N-acetyltransferase [Gammaproteobacteria bacterium]|nr:N-acetyltransferase [Gammaproteobacteria bacterium]